jgi:chromate transporter
MSQDSATLVTLAVHFAILSLFAMGGANAAVPEMHRLAVDVMRWMSDRQFADMFALAQVAPGPNVIVVTLIGYHVAGLAGAAVTTTAMCGPSCVFAFFMGRVWERFKDAPWRVAIQAGLVPISVGLVGASAVILTRAAEQNWLALGITAATAVVAYLTRWNPLWMFAAAALLGVAGVV